MSYGRRHFFALLLITAFGLTAVDARAQTDLLAEARRSFDFGKWEDAAKAVEELEKNKLLAAEDDLVDACRILGLSHLYLGHSDEARAAFVRLLSIDPDFSLDPLVVSPVAVEVFEAVRAENAELLASIRERRRAIAEQRRLEEETRKRLLEEEERKRRERASGPIVLQRVERHSFITNFLPFGAAQLEQGRSQVGALFAITQGLGLAGTVLTYSQVKSYIGQDGKVASDRLQAARGWRTANWIVFGATAALYLGGMIDAVLHYESETIDLVTMPRELNAPPAAQRTEPSAQIFVAPLEGGAAAGLAGQF
ncbi:MAG: tetratricopeptide repeat protein [Myxococcales bacterium]|jgi:tetratricopeptide (TPR) repeat protein